MILRRLENSRTFSIALLVGAFLLLVLALSDLGGELRERAELKSRSVPLNAMVLARKMELLFNPAAIQAFRPATNGLPIVYTMHFQPPPPPPAPAPPPAPTMKKVQLTFQGVYQTADGVKKAFIKVGEELVVGALGAKVVADWAVAEIALRTLTLKDAASQTNILEFSVAKEIEVPNQ